MRAGDPDPPGACRLADRRATGKACGVPGVTGSHWSVRHTTALKLQAMGVACQSCHGPASEWSEIHRHPDQWRRAALAVWLLSVGTLLTRGAEQEAAVGFTATAFRLNRLACRPLVKPAPAMDN